jgi:hypothetical protein
MFCTLYITFVFCIIGNWDGITDDETGIRAYALAVGRHICEDSIHPHHDPHKHLMHESQWTNMAIMTATANYNPFPLPCMCIVLHTHI